MPEIERGDLRPPESAAEEHRQDRAVAKTFGGGGVRNIQERLRLLSGEPIAKAHAFGRYPP
jgi:hypothetical protein